MKQLRLISALLFSAAMVACSESPIEDVDSSAVAQYRTHTVTVGEIGTKVEMDVDDDKINYLWSDSESISGWYSGGCGYLYRFNGISGTSAYFTCAMIPADEEVSETMRLLYPYMESLDGNSTTIDLSSQSLSAASDLYESYFESNHYMLSDEFSTTAENPTTTMKHLVAILDLGIRKDSEILDELRVANITISGLSNSEITIPFDGEVTYSGEGTISIDITNNSTALPDNITVGNHIYYPIAIAPQSNFTGFDAVITFEDGSCAVKSFTFNSFDLAAGDRYAQPALISEIKAAIVSSSDGETTTIVINSTNETDFAAALAGSTDSKVKVIGVMTDKDIAAFKDCSFTHVDLSSATGVTSIPNGIWTGNYTISMEGKSSTNAGRALVSISLPASITSIAWKSFTDCPNLEEVIFQALPSSLIAINAFPVNLQLGGVNYITVPVGTTADFDSKSNAYQYMDAEGTKSVTGITSITVSADVYFASGHLDEIIDKISSDVVSIEFIGAIRHADDFETLATCSFTTVDMGTNYCNSNIPVDIWGSATASKTTAQDAIVSLTLPWTVDGYTIEAYALANAPNLETVEFSSINEDGVVTLGGYFLTGTAVTEIVIPDYVTTFGTGSETQLIGGGALTSITLECSDPADITINLVADAELFPEAFKTESGYSITVPAGSAATYEAAGGYWANYSYTEATE